MALTKRRLKLKFGTNKPLMKIRLLESFIDLMWLIGMEWSSRKVTNKLLMGLEWKKNFKEQEAWCVAPISKIQEDERIKCLTNIEDKESIPLKLTIKGLVHCDSGRIWELLWSWELRKVIVASIDL